MKSNLRLLILAAGVAFITANGKRPSPPKNEKDNARRRREIEEYRLQEEIYPDFDAVMKKHGYEWAPHEVVTEDSWTLTMFQLTRRHGSHARDRRSDQPPILIIPGSFSDATSWLESADEGLPMPIQLFDRGFDVWLGNNRGTRYSNHNEHFADECEERWDFSWAEMGEYDLPAMIQMIELKTGAPKVTFIGYSMGTTQMFFGLLQMQDFYAQKLHKFVALAPCIYLNQRDFNDYQYGIGALRNLGIWVMNGPNWEEDKKTICRYLGPSACMNAMVISGQPQPIRAREWYAQIAVEGRFQEYAPDYLYGEREMPLIGGGLQELTEVPIHFIVGQDDSHCSLENAHRIAREIGPAVQSVSTIRGGTHLYFETSTDERYVDLIV